MVSGLTCIYLIHWVFLYVVWGNVPIFLMKLSSFPNTTFFFHCIFLPLCCRLIGHRCMGSLLGSLFCFISLCVCFCASTRLFSLLWFCSPVWSLEAWSFQICSSSGLFWQFGGLLWFYMNVWIIYSSSVKNGMVILIGIAFNLQIALGSMTILTVLILSIQEHRISSHFFHHLQFPSSLSQFSEHMFFTFKFIPRCFILFDVILKKFFFKLHVYDSLCRFIMW